MSQDYDKKRTTHHKTKWSLEQARRYESSTQIIKEFSNLWIDSSDFIYYYHHQTDKIYIGVNNPEIFKMDVKLNKDDDGNEIEYIESFPCYKKNKIIY